MCGKFHTHLQMGLVRVIISFQKFAFWALSPDPPNHFSDKKKFETWVFAIDVLNFFSPSCSASPEIIGVKVCHRRTDRQTNSLTPYTGVCGFFLSIKFATSLLASLAGGFAKLKLNVTALFPYYRFPLKNYILR